MKEIKCNHCGETFFKTEIKTESIEPQGEILRQFFACPKCGTEYTVLMTTRKTRDMINRRRAIQILLNTLRGSGQEKKIRKLINEDTELKAAIKQRSDAMKKEFKYDKPITRSTV